MNSGINALGQGHRANSTIGRALQLLVRNVGGGRPGEVDRAAHGSPSKVGFCFAEADHESPYGTLAGQRGLDGGVDAVTVFAGEGPRGVVDQLSRTPESLANTLGPGMLASLENVAGATHVFNLILTNVPGPQVPLYLFEHRMSGVCPLVPLFRGQGLGIAIFSYARTLTWGFHVDASRIDAARQLRSALAGATIRLARLADEVVSTSQGHEPPRPQPIPLHTSRFQQRERIASAAG